MSSSPDTQTPRGRFGTFGRPLVLVSALTILMLTIAVACGGGDDDENPRSGDNVEVTMSTFTPTSEADAANRDATRAARDAADAATATWVAENPPPPPPTRDPNATMAPQPTIDPDAEGMRPPFVWLSNGNDQMDGVFGNFSFVDLETGTVANAQAPFYNVGDEGLTVPPGGELQFQLQEDVTVPSSMTDEPTALSYEIFTWDENNAIPTGTDGSVEDRSWFVPSTEPVESGMLNPEEPWVVMPALPDRYVVRVEVTWPPFSNAENPQEIPVFAMYAFTVYVQ